MPPPTRLLRVGTILGAARALRRCTATSSAPTRCGEPTRRSLTSPWSLASKSGVPPPPPTPSAAADSCRCRRRRRRRCRHPRRLPRRLIQSRIHPSWWPPSCRFWSPGASSRFLPHVPSLSAPEVRRAPSLEGRRYRARGAAAAAAAGPAAAAARTVQRARRPPVAVGRGGGGGRGDCGARCAAVAKLQGQNEAMQAAQAAETKAAAKQRRLRGELQARVDDAEAEEPTPEQLAFLFARSRSIRRLDVASDSLELFERRGVAAADYAAGSAVAAASRDAADAHYHTVSTLFLRGASRTVPARPGSATARWPEATAEDFGLSIAGPRIASPRSRLRGGGAAPAPSWSRALAGSLCWRGASVRARRSRCRRARRSRCIAQAAVGEPAVRPSGARPAGRAREPRRRPRAVLRTRGALGAGLGRGLRGAPGAHAPTPSSSSSSRRASSAGTAVASSSRSTSRRRWRRNKRRHRPTGAACSTISAPVGASGSVESRTRRPPSKPSSPWSRRGRPTALRSASR